jgi:hypothetical protein
VTSVGEKWAYTVLPNATLSSPQVVFEWDGKTQDNSMWQQMYPEWNTTNLESHQVMDVPNQPFLFVHMNHPVIGLLRFNKSMIGCDIDTQPKLEKEYFKISRQVMSTCCQTIREEILDNMQTRDMTMFTLQIKPMSNAEWNELNGRALYGFKMDHSLTDEQQQARKAAHIKEYMTKQYEYIARLAVEYELPVT